MLLAGGVMPRRNMHKAFPRAALLGASREAFAQAFGPTESISAAVALAAALLVRG
jgi:hypothetical protein